MEWNDTLKVGLAAIDDDHEAFVRGVNATVAASDQEFPREFAALASHTREHFGREEAIMDQTGFFATAIHKAEHRRVLEQVEEVAARVAAGDVAFAREWVAREMPAWFLNHRATMDLATAMYARQRGCS